MKLVICILALAVRLHAQSLPLGETITQDGNSLILMPVPVSPNFHSLLVSVSPADLHATEIEVDVMLTTDEGRKQVCSTASPIHSDRVFTTLEITAASSIVSVQGVRIATYKPVMFGVVIRPHVSKLVCTDTR